MPSGGEPEAAKAAPNRRELLTALRRQVSVLEADLRQRSGSVDRFRMASAQEYEQARLASLTAATYSAWRDERITQVAAAWVLGMVYVRFCEDNGLIDRPFLAGPGKRLTAAEKCQEEFRDRHPEASDRDWIIAAFDHLARSNSAFGEIFNKFHNPLWKLSPSFEAATELVRFWRQREESGQIRFDFTNREDLDTGFLGDLYQDLSVNARRAYGLVQTPPFVVEFILDLTLEPAVTEFGLVPIVETPDHDGTSQSSQGLRCIDPACGSGTFLLAMFRRLLEKWRAAEPQVPDHVLTQRALDSVHGCDRNPFAVEITRFRLLIAAIQAGSERRLDRLPGFRIPVAVGDSLLRAHNTVSGDDLFSADGAEFVGSTEDISEFSSRYGLLAKNSYHVAVGNPPYISAKDKQENHRNRRTYLASGGPQPLSSYFLQRAFELTVRTARSVRGSGFVGLLMTSSFTKRESGRALIEDFLPTVDLTHVIDISRAYVPGQSTPTIILIGRHRTPEAQGTIRAVLGIQSEPYHPADPARGKVWQSVTEQVGRPGTRSAWLSVSDVDRSVFSAFPWNLAGSGEPELQTALERAPRRLGELLDQPIGIASSPGQDDAFIPGTTWFRMHSDAARMRRELMTGDDVRDWSASSHTTALVPYRDDNSLVPFDPQSSWGRLLWPVRQTLKASTGSGETTGSETGRPWWAWARWATSRYRSTPMLTFAAVSTRNHVALDSGETAFHQSAPVISLSSDSTPTDHLALLGVLNSSAVCFWLMQVSPSKTGGSLAGTIRENEWLRQYTFTGSILQRCPLPAELPLELSRSLHTLAQRLDRHEPKNSISVGIPPTRATLDSTRVSYTELRQQMIALQEELDWSVYGSYGILSPDEATRTTQRPGTAVPAIQLGERAFEIVLARAVAVGEADRAWFDLHGSTPVTEIPARWPAPYRAMVQARIDAIETRREVALIERPEYKRRWSSEPWEQKERQAVRSWLLDQCSDRRHWFQQQKDGRRPRTLTIDQLAEALGEDDRIRSIARSYATDWLGDSNAPLAAVLADVLATEQVPYLSAFRYKESGLRKHAQWEQVWDLQRKEDETGQPLGIPVPPKYTSTDFLKPSYWRQRGRLDIARERFISYPDVGPERSDSSLLLGWGGWDHLDQAWALADLVKAHADDDPCPTHRVTPLLAGLRELMPWVHQWHSGATELQEFLDDQCARHHLSAADLSSWRPSMRRHRRGAS